MGLVVIQGSYSKMTELFLEPVYQEVLAKTAAVTEGDIRGDVNRTRCLVGNLEDLQTLRSALLKFNPEHYLQGMTDARAALWWQSFQPSWKEFILEMPDRPVAHKMRDVGFAYLPTAPETASAAVQDAAASFQQEVASFAVAWQEGVPSNFIFFHLAQAAQGVEACQMTMIIPAHLLPEQFDLSDPRHLKETTGLDFRRAEGVSQLGLEQIIRNPTVEQIIPLLFDGDVCCLRRMDLLASLDGTFCCRDQDSGITGFAGYYYNFPALEADLMAVEVSDYRDIPPRAKVAATALAGSERFKSNLERFSAAFDRLSDESAAADPGDQQTSQQQMLRKFLNYCRVVSAGFTDDHEESKDGVLRALMVLGAQYTHWNEMTLVQSLQDPFTSLLEELQECLPWTLQLRPDAYGITRTEVISLEDRSRQLGLEDPSSRPRSGAQKISVLRGSYEQVIKLLFTPNVAESVFLQANALGQKGEEKFYGQLRVDLNRQGFAVPSPEDLEALVAAWRNIPSDGASYLQGGMNAGNLAENAVLPCLREEWLLSLLLQGHSGIYDAKGNFGFVGLSYLADMPDHALGERIKKPAALSIACRKDRPDSWILYHVANPHASISERIITVLVPEALLPPRIVHEALMAGCPVFRLPAMSQHCLEPFIQNIELTEIISLLFTPTHICNPRRLVFLAGLLDTSVDNSPVLLRHKGLEGASNFYIDFQKLKRALTEVGLGRISGKLNDDDLEVLQGVLAKDPNAEDCLKALYQVVLSAKKSSDLQRRLAASETSFLPKILVYLYIRKRLDLLEKLLPQQGFPVNVALSNHKSVVLLKDPSQAFLDKIQSLRKSIDCLEKGCEARESLEKLIDACLTIMDIDFSKITCARALLVLSAQYDFFKSMTKDPNPFIDSIQSLSVLEEFSAVIDQAFPIYRVEQSLQMPANFESEKRKALQGFLEVLKKIPQERIRQALAGLLDLLKRCLPSILEVKEVGGMPEVTMLLNERFNIDSPSMRAVNLSSDEKFKKKLNDLAVCFNSLEAREQRVLAVGRRFVDDCRALLHPETSATAGQRLSERYCRWLPRMLDEVTGFPEAQNTLYMAQARLYSAESELLILEKTMESLTQRLEEAITKKEFINANFSQELVGDKAYTDKQEEYKGLLKEEAEMKGRLFGLKKERKDLFISDKASEHGADIEKLTKKIGQLETELGLLEQKRLGVQELFMGLLSSRVSSLEEQDRSLENQILGIRRTQENIQRSLTAELAQEASLKVKRMRGELQVFFEKKNLLRDLLPEAEFAALSVECESANGLATAGERLKDNFIARAEAWIAHMRDILDQPFKSKPSLRKELNALRDQQLAERLAAAVEATEVAAAAQVTELAADQSFAVTREQLLAMVPEFRAAEQYVEKMLEAAKKPRLEMMSEAVECARAKYEAARAAIDKLKDEVAQNQSLSEYQKLIQQVLAHLKRVLAYVLDENLDVFGERYEKVIFNASLLQAAVGASPAALFHHGRTKSFSDLVVAAVSEDDVAMAAVVSEPVRPRSRSF